MKSTGIPLKRRPNLRVYAHRGCGGGMALRIIACHLRLLILASDMVCIVQRAGKGKQAAVTR